MILARVFLWSLCPFRAGADVLLPRGDSVALRQSGGGEVPLQIRALIAARPDSGAPLTEIPPTQILRFGAFRPQGNDLVTETSEGGITLRLRLGWEAGAGFNLHIAATQAAPTWVRFLAVEIEVEADSALVLGRDLRSMAVENVAVLGRLDPKWVSIYRRGRPLLTMLLGDEADGLSVRRLPGKVRVRLDLNSVEARPFFHFAACTDNWKDPNQRLILPARLLLSGEVQEADVALFSFGATPLVKARYPDGRRAALVITDHADQTAAPTLRALAGGTSDASDPRWGQGGLLGHGLPITKALWLRSGERDPAAVGRGPKGGLSGQSGQTGQQDPRMRRGDPEDRRARDSDGGERDDLELLQQLGPGQADENGGGRPQLDDPQVVALADRLFAAGWEVIPHSATPIRDSRDLTAQALAYFRRFSAKSWIDHQPYTNCEALVNQGYLPGRYGITDLLDQHGYQYAWAGLDMPPGDLNLLLPRRMDRYVPVIWPVGRMASGTPTGLWLFRSMLAFIETPRFFEMYGTDPLDRLERERGLHIAHTYLEDFHPQKSWFGRRNLLVAGKRPREVVLDPRLDALFSSLAARVARGSMWVPTMSHLGDHLRAMAGVTAILETDGSATLRSKTAVPGASFVVPRAGVTVLVDGLAPKGVRGAEGETSFWIDLPADRPVRVQLRSASGEGVSFLSPLVLPPQTLGRTP